MNTSHSAPGGGASKRIALIAGGSVDPEASSFERLKKSGWRWSVVEGWEDLLRAASKGDHDLILIESDLALPSAEDSLVELLSSDPSKPLLLVQDGELVFSPDKRSPVLVAGSPDEQVCQALLMLRESPWAEWSWGRRLTSLEICHTDAALDGVREAVEWLALDENEALRLELVFQEAITNSVEHGNLGLKSEWREEFDKDGIDRYAMLKAERLKEPIYANRTVEIQLWVIGPELVISLHDEGEGFDTEKVRSYQDDRPEAVHGRGIRILSEVMDSVFYADGGRRLVLRRVMKRREGGS